VPVEPRPQLILVDTSAYFALVDRSDRHHAAAVAFVRSNAIPLATTDLIVKEFSFTDCTSFALMERMRITTAFAFDIHFHQYGRFTILP
jgi:predicted nucleic acid-binding protein